MATFDAILTCARDNDAAGIRKLIALGCPPSFGNKMGQTALHIGGIWGSIEAVKALLEARADPNAQNKLRGSAPLHACAMGRGPADRRAECARLLVAAKGDPSMQDLSGETPMDAAADDELRLALGAVPLHLHKAVQSRSSKAVADCLATIRAGRLALTVDTPNQAGDTALHLAADLSGEEGVELLWDEGVWADCRNHGGRAPLHLAALKGNHRLVQLLLERSAPAGAKDLDLERDPRSKDAPAEHRTALHYAAQLGNVLVMRLLLEKGKADPNSRDANQETPLFACLQLRESGAELEPGGGVRVVGLQSRLEWNGRLGSLLGPRATRDGAEPRWPVLIEGEAGDAVLLKEPSLQRLPDEALDLLLEARADVNADAGIAKKSRTALHEAARTGDVVLAGRCLAAGAEVNKQDERLGLAALHMAARGRHHGVARLLVEARADVNQISVGGKTAAELARVNGCADEQLAIYRGEDCAAVPAAGEQQAPPQTLESLTPEQRALLFIE